MASGEMLVAEEMAMLASSAKRSTESDGSESYPYPPLISRPNGLLILLSFVAYLPVTAAGFIWDDPAHVTENLELRTLSGLWRIWFVPGATQQYYPLVFSSFWIEYHLWQLNPLGYHVDNVLLHSFNAVLLYRIFFALKLPGAFVAAAIFAVHPVHVESVAWVTERKNVLSGFFYLLAFLAYWRFASGELSAAESPIRFRRSQYAFAVLFFICALFSKSVTASLPAAILVIWWWQHGRIGWRQILPLGPFFLIGLLAGLNTAHIENIHIGAEGADWNWSVWERCLIAGRAAWFYLGKLVWPQPLIFIYPKWKIEAGAIWQIAFPVFAIVLLVSMWVARRFWGRGPLAAALFFGGTLVPALGFVNIYPMRFTFVADHYQYLASIGAISLLVGACSHLAKRWNVSKQLSTPVAGLIVLALLTTSFFRCFDYRGREEIWSATIADNPECWLATLHLAGLRMEQNRYLEALPLLEIVLSLKNREPHEPSEMADLHLRMADCCRFLGDNISAEKHVRSSLEFYRMLENDKFQDPLAIRFNIAISHRRLGELDQAVTEFYRVLELKPDDEKANHELGSLLLQLHRFVESEPHLQKALDKNAENPFLHFELANLYLAMGKPTLAREHLLAALVLEPKFEKARQLLNRIPASTQQ